MPIEWDRPLSNRRGGHDRLGGLVVYYDFNWREIFRHNRSVFPRGQSLAQLVRRECPEGKTPCLLLTERIDIQPSIQQTEDTYIVVVPIHDYLNNAGADAASSYYARLSAAPLTRLSTLSEEVFSSGELGNFLDAQLTPEALAGWVQRLPSRLETLRDLVASETDPLPVDIASALADLSVQDARVLEEFVNYVSRTGGRLPFEDLLARVTRLESGRVAAAEALGHRLSERIADIRRRLTDYENLIARPDSTETGVQHFLEEHPWIVGLPYINARPHVEIPRGELDFVLDRYDGFFDVMELKGPREPIIIERQNLGADRPPPASSYSLSPALSAALAQSHHYRAILDQSGDLRAQYGLTDSRQPRILVVLGSSASLSNSSREILRQLNLSLHRVEVIPYDLLGTRTRVLLDNLESLIGAVRQPDLAG